MSPKDNFAQTMKDLLNGGEGAPQGEEKKASADFAAQDVAAEEEYLPAQEGEYEDVYDEQEGEEGYEYEDDYTAPPAAPRVPSNEVTIIAPGTKIIGDIDTDGGLRIGGSIKGNVHVAATLELNGKVIGDIEAEDIKITTSVIKGNVTARNLINMDKDTTVVGDVAARNVEIDGKIKGNLSVSERAHIETDSILVGNLISGTVNIEEGAMLKGDISITNIQGDDVDVDIPDFDIDIGL